MSSTNTAMGCGCALVTAAVLVMAAGSVVAATWDERVQSCTVTDKDRGAGDGTYRVYTEQCGTLQNADSLWHGKWDSADVQGALEPGQTYDLRLTGWRFEPLSMFPNIVAIEPS